MIFPEEVLKTSTGCSGPQGLLGSQRNTQKKQGILSTTKGHPGPVHVFRTSRRRPTGTSRGSLRNTRSRSLPRSQLRSGFQSMNFITTPGKVLLDIQSINMFLLMKYTNFLHFYSGMS
jgi:hypothetical protein